MKPTYLIFSKNSCVDGLKEFKKKIKWLEVHNVKFCLDEKTDQIFIYKKDRQNILPLFNECAKYSGKVILGSFGSWYKIIRDQIIKKQKLQQEIEESLILLTQKSKIDNSLKNSKEVHKVLKRCVLAGVKIDRNISSMKVKCKDINILFC